MKMVTAAIIEKKGKILIAKRKKGGVVGGKWEFPGGKIEWNETPREGLKRELKEELNIDAEVEKCIGHHIFFYGRDTIRSFTYAVSNFKGDMKLQEHDEIRWVSANELNKYDFIGNNKPIIDDLSHAYGAGA